MADTKTLIFPTDFSEASRAALDWVRRMADTFEATVHCVSCVQNPVILQPTVGAIYPTMEDLRGEAEKRLEEFAAEYLSDLAQPVKRIVLTGRPADEIVSYAAEIKAEMVIMATHGHSGLAHIIIGSTTENVLRHAKCPVLSIRA